MSSEKRKRRSGPLTACSEEMAGIGKEQRKASWRDLAGWKGSTSPNFMRRAIGPDGLIESFSPRGNFPARVKRVWLRQPQRIPDPLGGDDVPYRTIGNASGRTQPGVPQRMPLLRGMLHLFSPPGPGRRPAGGGDPAKAPARRKRWGWWARPFPITRTCFPWERRFSIPKKPLSFSSLRVDSLTPELAELVSASGQKTVTLAPEAGSERMRRIVRKGFTEEEILRAAEILHDHGIRSFRLYFMIGLPAETPEDVKAIVDLTKKIRHHLLQEDGGKKAGRKDHPQPQLLCSQTGDPLPVASPRGRPAVDGKDQSDPQRFEEAKKGCPSPPTFPNGPTCRVSYPAGTAASAGSCWPRTSSAETGPRLFDPSI